MLLTLLLFGALLALSLPVGAAACRFTRLHRDLDREEDLFLARAWLGLLIQAGALLWISHIVPMQPWGPIAAAVLAAAGAVAGGHGWPPVRSMRLPAAALAVSAVVCSGLIMLHDTGLYHAGMVRWLSEYGLTPGMSLVSYRFGFSSSWFPLAASLNLDAWQGRAMAAGNGLVFALMLAHLLIALARARRGDARPADWLALGASPVLLAFTVLQRAHVSASPNLAVAGGVFLTGWLLHSTRGAAAVVLAGALAAVKLTAAPVLLAGMAARRNALAWAAAALAIPLLSANFRSTGCPLFPSALACAGSGPVAGIDKARYVERETRDWARYLERLPEGTSWMQFDWIAGWFRSPSNTAFFLLAVAGAVIVLLRRAWDAAAFAGLLSFAWVMATVPDARLGYGAAALLTGLALRALAGHRKRLPLPAALGPLLCFAVILDGAAHEAGYYWLLGESRARFTWSRLLTPPEIKQPAQVVQRSVNDVRFLIPAGPGALCWGAPQPCIIMEPDPMMRLCRPAAGIGGGICRGSLPTR